MEESVGNVIWSPLLGGGRILINSPVILFKVNCIAKANNEPTVMSNRRRQTGLKTKTTSVPIAKNVQVLTEPPKITSFGSKTVIVAHELLTNVNNSVEFSAIKIHMNPGLTIFKWLSNVAQRYEMYRFTKLQLVYVPSRAVVTTPGSVTMGFDYDPEDHAPHDLPSLSTFETLSTGRVFNAIRLNVNTSLMFLGMSYKRVRSGPVAGDLGLYDGGHLIFSTVAGDSVSLAGQLWAYYRIELVSPQVSFEPGETEPHTHTHAMFQSGADQILDSTVPTPVKFGAVLINGLEIGQSDESTFLVPAGVYTVSGEATFADSVSEQLALDLQLTLDGAAPVPLQEVSKRRVVQGQDHVSLGFTFCVVLNKIQTAVRLLAIAVGAAGTLRSLVGQTRIAFTIN